MTFSEFVWSKTEQCKLDNGFKWKKKEKKKKDLYLI